MIETSEGVATRWPPRIDRQLKCFLCVPHIHNRARQTANASHPSERVGQWVASATHLAKHPVADGRHPEEAAEQGGHQVATRTAGASHV